MRKCTWPPVDTVMVLCVPYSFEDIILFMRWPIALFSTVVAHCPFFNIWTGFPVHCFEWTAKFCRDKVALQLPLLHLYCRDASDEFSKADGFLISSNVIGPVLVQCGSRQIGCSDWNIEMQHSLQKVWPQPSSMGLSSIPSQIEHVKWANCSGGGGGRNCDGNSLGMSRGRLLGSILSHTSWVSAMEPVVGPIPDPQMPLVSLCIWDEFKEAEMLATETARYRCAQP